MSYDYDYIIIDWNEGTFIIMVDMNEYEYEIASEGDLLYGGLENGVAFEEQHVSIEEPDEWEDETESESNSEEW